MNSTTQFSVRLRPLTRFARSGQSYDLTGNRAIDAIQSIAKKVGVALLAFGVAAMAYAATTTVTINDPATADGYNPTYFVSSTPANPETHVIGIYETRSDHSPGNHPEGTAYVHISGTSTTPVNLVLSSYEPTNWVLDGAGLSSVGKVVVSSYYDSRVTGIASSKVSNKSGSSGPLGLYAYEWSTTPGSNAQGLVQSVEFFFRTGITSFSGVYRATDFSIDLVPNDAPAGTTPDATAGTTGLYFNSTSGDYIGQGLVKTWTPADGTFTAKKNYDNGVEIYFDGGSQAWWHLNFAAPQDALLTVGDYTEATRWPFQLPTKPGLDVSGTGRGCNNSFGKFTITEMTYGTGDEILVFAADFEQHCEQEAAPALRGRVLFNAETTTLPSGSGTTQDLLPSFVPALDSDDDGTVTLSIDVNVSRNHQGRQGKVFLAAKAGSDLYLHDGKGWILYTGGTLPAYKSGPLVSTTINVIQDVNPGALSGVSIVVGYGVSDVDMLTNNRYRLVHTF